jgi:DNA polymerase-3 subunit alpha
LAIRLKVQDQDGYQAIPAGAVISLRVAPELETAATQQRLLEIFTKYHGTNMIFLELMGSRKRIRVMPQYYIKAGDKELQKEIAELLGPKALKWMNV